MKKKTSKNALVEELKELLFADKNTEADGVLALAGRNLSGDLVARKIARIKEIVKGL